MFIYALAVEPHEDQLNVVLLHSERKSLKELYEKYSQEVKYNDRFVGSQPEFKDWLVEEHGFVISKTIVFNTDSEEEFEL